MHVKNINKIIITIITIETINTGFVCVVSDDEGDDGGENCNKDWGDGGGEGCICKVTVEMFGDILGGILGEIIIGLNGGGGWGDGGDGFGGG